MCTSVVAPPCPHPSHPPLRGGGCESSAGGSSAALPTISPEELHRYLLRAHRLENRVKYRFIEGLRAMDAGRLYLKLGYSSTRQYAEKHFGWERSRVYEALRVAGCLEKLPLTKEAFMEGFPYSRVEEITRVATAETEAEWIDFARKTSMRKLRVEVQDARDKNRKHPRSGSFGLPAVRMRLPFDFSPEEYDLLEKALRKISKELLAGSIGRTRSTPSSTTAVPTAGAPTLRPRTGRWRSPRKSSSGSRPGRTGSRSGRRTR